MKNLIKSFIVKQIDINTNFIHWSNDIKIDDFLEFLIEVENNDFLKKYMIFLKQESKGDYSYSEHKINDLINYYYFYLNTDINNYISVNDFLTNIKEFIKENCDIFTTITNSINLLFLKAIKAVNSISFGSYYKNPNEKEDLAVLEKIKNLIENRFYKDNINGGLYKKVLDEDKILNLKRKSIFKFVDKI